MLKKYWYLITLRLATIKKKGAKYFIRYKNDYEEITSLVVRFPKMSRYHNKYKKDKYMSFKVKDKKF